MNESLLEEIDLISVTQNSFLPGYSEFTSTAANFALKYWTKGDNSSTSISTEHLLVKCLMASLYEVRLIVLEFLCRIFYDNIENGNETEGNEEDVCVQMPISGDKEKMKTTIEKSNDILNQLIGMALDGERHHECVVKVIILKFL